MFNNQSYITKLWVQAVKNGTYQKEQVPKLSNLQEVVYCILEEPTADVGSL